MYWSVCGDNRLSLKSGTKQPIAFHFTARRFVDGHFCLWHPVSGYLCGWRGNVSSSAYSYAILSSDRKVFKPSTVRMFNKLLALQCYFTGSVSGSQFQDRIHTLQRLYILDIDLICTHVPEANPSLASTQNVVHMGNAQASLRVEQSWRMHVPRG